MTTASPEPQGVMQVLRTYQQRVKAFQPNARKYLYSIMIFGFAMGIRRLLFNFYVLSLGYDEALLGVLITANSMAALLAALPAGYLADRIGHKNALVLGSVLVGFSTAMMVFFPSPAMFIAMSIIGGAAQSLNNVTMGPFLMDNSQQEERTYLFSFSSGLNMAFVSVGEWLGGYLPTWFALAGGFAPTDTSAYAWALMVASLVALLSIVPRFFMKATQRAGQARNGFALFKHTFKKPKLLLKLIIPTLVTSVGAGLLMPFMNVFFRNVHHQSDQAIGMMFAWGSLAMGVGLLIAPAIADRFGKIKVVVISQALSIPFLFLLGFAPWFWLSVASYYIRVALMNMSGPVYNTFVMEQVDEESRGMVASLSSMAGNFGWAFSPTISGYFQVSYGFDPVFLSTISLYVVSVVMYYVFFWKKRKGIKQPASAPAELPTSAEAALPLED